MSTKTEPAATGLNQPLPSASMSRLLKLEELAGFAFSLLLLHALGFAGWVFWAFLFTPDLSMLGYLVSSKAGAFLYNVAHHKGTAVLVYVCGMCMNSLELQAAGLILFAHASLDRVFGYGLKYSDSFFNTHLGRIGKSKQPH
jgi:hypothetical protein